jgi:hypothetical protein
MGARGPVPKPVDQQRNTRGARGAGRTIGRAGPTPTIPACPVKWHEIAKAWFKSLKTSGQSSYYEASDWTHALFIGEAMSRWLSYTSADKAPAQLFQAICAGMNDLLTTEGMRRRVKLELIREPETTPSSIALMQSYRDRHAKAEIETE